MNLLYFSVASSVNLSKSSIVGNIGKWGSNGSSIRRLISVSSLAMDGIGLDIGTENVGGDDVLGEGGRIAFTVLAASNCCCFLCFLSLLLLHFISSISAEEATSDWVTWDVADVNSISLASSWSSSVSTVSAYLIVLDTLLFLVTPSLPRRLGFGSGRGLADPSLEKTTFDDILLDYCFILLYKPYATIQAFKTNFNGGCLLLIEGFYNKN